MQELLILSRLNINPSFQGHELMMWPRSGYYPISFLAHAESGDW